MADDLYTAVLEQNVDKVQILLETGADPNTDHALEKAVDKCNLDIVTLLIDNGADVNKISRDFMIKLLPNVNINGELHLVDEYGIMNVVWTTTKEKGNTLKMAASKGSIKMVRYLIEKGADINKGDVLEIAAWVVSIDIVRLLLDKGSDIKETMALRTAALKGRVDIVSLLLDKGASPDQLKTTVGEMPVLNAAINTVIARKQGFPNVLGCVDGTFVRILSPKEREGEFINRKGFHSLNVQMVCDAKFRILNCVAKWPGSVHDSRVFRESNLCIAFESGVHQGFLLGDSGYPCKKFLLTPFIAPTNNSQANYNRSHARTRVLIEQTFGILKRRFNCLHDGIRTSPERTCTMIMACAVLHNIGIERNDIIDNDFSVENVDDVNVNLRDDWDGTNVRDYLCHAYFQ